MARFAKIFMFLVCCLGGAALAVYVSAELSSTQEAALSASSDATHSLTGSQVAGPEQGTAINGNSRNGVATNNALAADRGAQPASASTPLGVHSQPSADNPLQVQARALPVHPDHEPEAPSAPLLLDPALQDSAPLLNHSHLPGDASNQGSAREPSPSRQHLPHHTDMNALGDQLAERFVNRVGQLWQESPVQLAAHAAPLAAANTPARSTVGFASANLAQEIRPRPNFSEPDRSSGERIQPDLPPPAHAPANPALPDPAAQYPPPANPNGAAPHGPLPAESLRMRRSDELAPGTAAPVRPRDEHMEIFARNEDLRDVLTMLGEQAGVNIVTTKSVMGQVSVALNRVTVDAALNAILRSTGYIARRENNFIYVGTPADFLEIEQSNDAIETRVYRPSYITAYELQLLITPLLTPSIGRISVTTPAKQGIAPNDSEAGGDNLAEGEAVLVQDRVTVLAEIDQVMRELDRRPMQVAIEAMILSVVLDDKHECGVDFEFLRNQGTIRLGVGAPITSLDGVNYENGGLKFAFLDSNMGSFVKCLETIGDTSVIASPRVMVLNKQRAEILIGAQLGYVNTTVTETTATQSVEFLEVGTQLRLRPFISPDGLIRMEVHPELSTGRVRVEAGFTLPDKDVTKVTSNVMVRDGATVIIGGLMREDLKTDTKQVPLLGSLPLLGKFFQTTAEQTQRREIVVLLTPRIVTEPEMNIEGDQAACDFHRRHQNQADQMSHFTRNYLGEKYYRLAKQAYQQGDRERAWRYIQLSLEINPSSRAAIELRANMAAGVPADAAQAGAVGLQGPLAMEPGTIVPVDSLDQQDVPPWLLNELSERPQSTVLPHPRDPGVSGYSRPIVRPGREP